LKQDVLGVPKQHADFFEDTPAVSQGTCYVPPIHPEQALEPYIWELKDQVTNSHYDSTTAMKREHFFHPLSL
jgi:hypothetical protein